MKYKIEVPNNNFKGERLGIRFVDGVGYTDDERLAKELDLNEAYEVSQVEDSAADPWDNVTIKMIDAYAKDSGITWADDVKKKGHKVAALEQMDISATMVYEGVKKEDLKEE